MFKKTISHKIQKFLEINTEINPIKNTIKNLLSNLNNREKIIETIRKELLPYLNHRIKDIDLKTEYMSIINNDILIPIGMMLAPINLSFQPAIDKEDQSIYLQEIVDLTSIQKKETIEVNGKATNIFHIEVLNDIDISKATILGWQAPGEEYVTVNSSACIYKIAYYRLLIKENALEKENVQKAMLCRLEFPELSSIPMECLNRYKEAVIKHELKHKELELNNDKRYQTIADEVLARFEELTVLPYFMMIDLLDKLNGVSHDIAIDIFEGIGEQLNIPFTEETPLKWINQIADIERDVLIEAIKASRNEYDRFTYMLMNTSKE